MSRGSFIDRAKFAEVSEILKNREIVVSGGKIGHFPAAFRKFDLVFTNQVRRGLYGDHACSYVSVCNQRFRGGYWKRLG